MSYWGRLPAFLGFILIASSATAQGYPGKPVHLVVPYAAGGTTDIVCRLIAQKLVDRLGQPVVVENRPGGDALIGTDAVAKAAPGGYALLCTASSAITILPHTHKRLPYDPFKDFVHVVQTTYNPYVLAVNPSVPAATVAELVALARSKPGQLTYATGSASGGITGELFKFVTRTDIVYVPYKGVAPATTDLLSGQVNMMFATFANVIPYVKAGKLRPLAVTGGQRSVALPEVPTMAEAGIKDFEASGSYGISVPRGTPTDIVRKLNGEVSAVLGAPDIVEKILAQGVEPRIRSTQEYTAQLRAEFEKYRVLLPRIGIKPE